MQKITPAEKVAVAIGKLMSDLHLDIDSVGYYLYRSLPPLMYNRFQEVASSAEHEKQMHTNEDYRRKMNQIGL